MRWTCLLPWVVGLCLWPSVVSATSWVGPQNLGIVCLDEATGRPEWEYFPDRLGSCDLAADGERLYMLKWEWLCYSRDPLLDLSKTQVIHALDLATRKEAPNAKLPDTKQLTLEASSRRPLILASGDRVVASASNQRVITIMKGDSDEVRSIIQTPLLCGSLAGGPVPDLFVRRNLVISVQYEMSPDRRQPVQRLTAFNATSQRVIWTRDFKGVRRIWGWGQGEGRLYICEDQGVRSLDLDTGKWAWSRQLPRVLGFSHPVEHGGRVYVVCDYFSGPPTYYLYCLDVATGKTLWTYDPDDSLCDLPLLFKGRKVYTQIGPTRLMQATLGAYGEKVGERLRERFAGRTNAAIELQLRAWHVLGDRSALSALKAAETVLAAGTLKDLPRTLAESFPSVRDPMALLRFLAAEFDRKPDLRIEIRRILDDFNPVPYWYDHATVGFPPRPAPKLDLTPERQALIDVYKPLKKRADEVPYTGLDRNDVYDILGGHGSASLDALAQAFETATDANHREMIVAAIVRLHKEAGADWALKNASRLTPIETEHWIREAPVEWIKKHPDLVDQWLRSGNNWLQLAAAKRLYELDEAVAVSICVDLLKSHVKADQDKMVPTLRAAMFRLTRPKRSEYIPLIREYLNSNMATLEWQRDYTDAQTQYEMYPLREAAMLALKEMGIEVFVATKIPKRTIPPPVLHSSSRPSSQVASLPEESYRSEEEGLFDTLASRPATADIKSILGTLEPSARTNVVRRLIEANRLDAASSLLRYQLHEDPSDWAACVGMAQVHYQRQQLAEADAFMERAILLLPVPSDSPEFKRTITYWLDRGRPERVDAWLRESATGDFESWKAAGLFPWVEQYPQLRKTAESVLRAGGRQQAVMPYGLALGVMGAVLIAGVLVAYRFARRRSANP